MGEWLYDGTTPTLVRIVQLDYDLWYAVGEAHGDLGPDEAPALSQEGALFYVRHRPGWVEGKPFWPDPQGFATIEEAKEAAQVTAPTPIGWR